MTNEYLIRTVAEDLEYFDREWGNEVTDATLRRGSTTLRKLLIQGDLFKAWNAKRMADEPYVIAPRLEAGLFCTPTQRPHIGLAGGGEFGALHLSLAVAHISAEPEPPPHIPDAATTHRFRLAEFVESASLYAEDTVVSRGEIVKYVANKLGGAHTDFSRRKKDAVHALLDRVAPQFAFLTSLKLPAKNAVYFELLSIGQLVGRSPSMRAFVAAANG